MAEHKACADLVAVTGDSVANSHAVAGECVSPVDDSGTESGEDFRLLSPEILAEVQNALTRLEAALPGLDPVRREALVRLVTRLQSCLRLQPAPPTPPQPAPPNPPPPQPPVKRYANRRQRQQRHTVGVSREELADARRWLIETGQQPDPSADSSVLSESQSSNLNEFAEQKPQVFRPVRFTPNQPKSVDYHEVPNGLSDDRLVLDVSGLEEPVVSDTSSNYFSQNVTKVDSGSSLLEYDPSLQLFTPAQSVQIAVHKAAINKQLSEEGSKRESSRQEESYGSEDGDGDVSSVDEERAMTSQQGLEDAISSAQRLLQIASDNKTPSRFQGRNSKKQKMKRSNTIDILKPNDIYIEGSSPDDDDANKNRYVKNNIMPDKTIPPPTFKPKTESDLKFLAFLQQANKNEGKASVYNPSARGGQPWTNRFVNLKTSFESPDPKPPPKLNPPSVIQMWEEKITKAPEAAMRQPGINRTPQPLSNKLPWNTSQEDEGVVVGSLTVKPGHVNKFSHALKSAFKPIEKKAISQPQKAIVQPQKPVVQYQPKPTYNNQFNQKNKLQDSKKSSQQAVVNGKVTSAASGSVKQLATEKFSGDNVSSKPIIKQYPAIQDKHFNAANSVKQHPFVEQISKPSNIGTAVNHASQPPQQFPNSIVSVHRQLTAQPELDAQRPVKIPQASQTKSYKEGSVHSPPKQYINSPPLSKPYSEPFEFPTKQTITNSYMDFADQNDRELQEILPEQTAVPYYSQVPAYVQHSTYAQPLIDYASQTSHPSRSVSHPSQQYPSTPDSIEEYPATYSQYNNSFAHPEENHYTPEVSGYYDKENISNVQNQKRTEQPQISYSRTNSEEKARHVFTDKSLVPNPLVLGDVYKQESTEYIPPILPPDIKYEPPPIEAFSTPSYKPSLVAPTIKTIPSATNNLYENNSSQGSLTSSKLSESSSSIKQYLSIPFEYGNDVSPVISNNSKSPYLDESVNSSGAPSPHWNQDEVEDTEISVSEGTEMQTAITKVMGQSQCQKAVTVSNRTQHRFENDKSESDSLLRALLKSPHSPTNISRKQSSEKINNYTEPPQPSKSPLLDKPSRSKLSPDAYSYPVVSKPPVIVTPPSVVQNNQSNLAAAAFHPLVNNFSKPPEPEYYKPSPVLPSPPLYGKKPDPDSRLVQSSTRSSSSNSTTYVNKYSEIDSLPKPTSRASPSRSPLSTSPSFPNVLQKSESWHQLVKEQSQVRHPPPKSPRLAKTKSSHSLAFPKQYEAHLTPDKLAGTQSKVDQYLKPPSIQSATKIRQTSKQKKTVSIKLDESLDNVDEAFESLFQEVAKRK